MRGMRKNALLLAACVLAAVTSASVGGAEPERPKFPEFQLTDVNGKVHEMKDFLGAVTLVNFWATWCGPCRQELPELQKLYNELGTQGFTVLAIAVDTPPEKVKPFLDRMGITLPAMLIDRETEAALGVSRIPFSVLLDREGRVVQVYPGYAPSVVDDMRERAEALLVAPRTQGGK